PDQAAQQRDPAGQLLALPRGHGPRARGRRAQRSRRRRMRPLPRQRRAWRPRRPGRPAARRRAPSQGATVTMPISTRQRRGLYVAILVLVAASTAGITALLMNIFERKAEQRTPYLRVVEVGEDDTDPVKWGKNWPNE